VVRAPGQKAVSYPVLMVVGLESDEPSFDRLLGDYEGFLSRLSLPNGQMGARLSWVDRSGQPVPNAGNGPGAAELARARQAADTLLADEEVTFTVTGKGGIDFDREAALAALSDATGQARSCRADPAGAGGPHGSGMIRVVFARSGYVQSATLEGDAVRFSGTPVGQCVVGSFRMAAVPPFERDPVVVLKRFSVD
jgi:hypothetical protein